MLRNGDRPTTRSQLSRNWPKNASDRCSCWSQLDGSSPSPTVRLDELIGSFIDRQGQPGVGLGRFAARTWENLVQAFQDFCVQRNFRGTQGGLQLLDGSGTDDRRSHDGVFQK